MKKIKEWWENFKLEWLHICPCGGKVECWSWGKYKCMGKCGKTYFSY